MKNYIITHSWNGYYYAHRSLKKEKYYKCKTQRFDDTFGGVVEITPDEYFATAEKYAKVMWR